MLILLGVSTALAIVTPDPRDPDQTEETTTPTGPTGATGPDGDGDGDEPSAPDEFQNSKPLLVEATVKPETKNRIVRASAGDRLVLTVQTDEPATVEIPALGLTGTTTRYAPAVFDAILPEDPESIRVIEVGSDGKPVATIETGV